MDAQDHLNKLKHCYNCRNASFIGGLRLFTGRVPDIGSPAEHPPFAGCRDTHAWRHSDIFHTTFYTNTGAEHSNIASAHCCEWSADR